MSIPVRVSLEEYTSLTKEERSIRHQKYAQHGEELNKRIVKEIAEVHALEAEHGFHLEPIYGTALCKADGLQVYSMPEMPNKGGRPRGREVTKNE